MCLSLSILLRQLCLAFVTLHVVLSRRAVCSHGGGLQEYAQVLCEVGALDHIQTLIFIQLTSLRKTGSLAHLQELQPFLVPYLVL